MRCFVGIDLGSTTTKAVVLDPQGDVLGRGITNSRSNYDVACAVARNEAMLDARFRLFERHLLEQPDVEAHAALFLDSLQRNFRLESHLHLLGELEEGCRLHAEHGPEPRPMLRALERMFARLRDETQELFVRGRKPPSDFFRDLAGSRYMSLAEAAAKQDKLSYEALVALFDKSIITVEAHVPEVSLQEIVQRVLDSTLREYRVSRELERTLHDSVLGVMDISLTEARVVGTGYGRARLPFAKEHIRSEILCHGLGAHATFPGTRTVLDIGGQDTKAIQIDSEGIVEGFQMNDRCAAGCGRYLGYIADEMNVGLHELGPLAMRSCRPARINSTCTVFAGAELRDRLAGGERREDILAGLHRAIMLRATSLLARSGGVHEELTFTGGVARNEAAVAALRELVLESWGERTLNISPDSIYTGALGAALFAWREENDVASLAGAGATGGAA